MSATTRARAAIRRLTRTRLTRIEKRWAEVIFAAILAPEVAGLPGFDRVDRTAFWRAVDDRTGELFGHGLRAMVALVTFLPVADRRHRRPLFALDHDARRALVAELAADPRFAVRQAIVALKMLAGMAYLDDPVVRARFTGEPAVAR